MDSLPPKQSAEQINGSCTNTKPIWSSFSTKRQVSTDVSWTLDHKETLTERRVRIYLLRHFPYVPWTNDTMVYKGLEDERMPPELKQNLSTTFDGIFTNPNKVLFLYDGTTGQDRTKETAVDLIQRYNIPKEHIRDSIKLRGTYSRKEKRIKRRAEAYSEFLEIEKLLASEDLSWIETVVIIGNRTYTPMFHSFSIWDKEIAEKQLGEELERQWYVYCETDVHLNPISKNPKDLSISPEFYTIFQGLFPEFWNNNCTELQYNIWVKLQKNKNNLERCLQNPNSPSELRRFCLYHLLQRGEYEFLRNYYLSVDISRIGDAEKELILEHTKSHGDSGLFENLFIFRKEVWGNINPLEFIPSLLSSCQSLSQTLSSSTTRATNIFQYSLDTQIQKDKSNLIERTLHSYRKKTPAEIQALEEKRERDGQKKSLSEEDYYTKQSSTLDTILSSALPSILLGYVGNGKSHELARMYQELRTNLNYLNYIPLFYSAKESKGDICSVIQKEVASIRSLLPNKKIAVFFDGLDELSWALHQEVENLLKSLHKPKDTESESLSVIIGSRPSGFNKYGDDSFSVIHFDNLSPEQRDVFLLSRLRKPDENGNPTISEEEAQKRLKEIQDFLENGMLEEYLKNTPLILFFLTRLVDTESIEDSEWKKLFDIRNRAELYEQITRRILVDHQANANNKNVKLDDGYTGLLFDTLGYCAFLKHETRLWSASNSEWTSEPPVTREIILKYLKQRNRYLTEVSQNLICDQIFILYHQKERGGYEFILKSFEEFFLARYLTTLSNGSDLIYQVRDTCRDGNDGKWLNWGDWRAFKPVVMFYGQLLGNRIEEEILYSKYDGDEDIIWSLTPEQKAECLKNATGQDSESLARLVAFLGEEGILKNDDIFGEGFFIGLEMILNLAQRGLLIWKLSEVHAMYFDQLNSLELEDIKNSKLFQYVVRATEYFTNDGYNIESQPLGKYIHQIISNDLSKDNLDFLLQTGSRGTMFVISRILAKMEQRIEESWYDIKSIEKYKNAIEILFSSEYPSAFKIAINHPLIYLFIVLMDYEEIDAYYTLLWEWKKKESIPLWKLRKMVESLLKNNTKHQHDGKIKVIFHYVTELWCIWDFNDLTLRFSKSVESFWPYTNINLPWIQFRLTELWYEDTFSKELFLLKEILKSPKFADSVAWKLWEEILRHNDSDAMQAYFSMLCQSNWMDTELTLSERNNLEKYISQLIDWCLKRKEYKTISDIIVFAVIHAIYANPERFIKLLDWLVDEFMADTSDTYHMVYLYDCFSWIFKSKEESVAMAPLIMIDKIRQKDIYFNTGLMYHEAIMRGNKAVAHSVFQRISDFNEERNDIDIVECLCYYLYWKDSIGLTDNETEVLYCRSLYTPFFLGYAKRIQDAGFIKEACDIYGNLLLAGETINYTPMFECIQILMREGDWSRDNILYYLFQIIRAGCTEAIDIAMNYITMDDIVNTPYSDGNDNISQIYSCAIEQNNPIAIEYLIENFCVKTEPVEDWPKKTRLRRIFLNTMQTSHPRIQEGMVRYISRLVYNRELEELATIQKSFQNSFSVYDQSLTSRMLWIYNSLIGVISDDEIIWAYKQILQSNVISNPNELLNSLVNKVLPQVRWVNEDIYERVQDDIKQLIRFHISTDSSYISNEFNQYGWLSLKRY